MIKFRLRNRLCTDLQTLIHERAEIEKAYAKSLRAWSKKWGELIEKGNYTFFVIKFLNNSMWVNEIIPYLTMAQKGVIMSVNRVYKNKFNC